MQKSLITKTAKLFSIASLFLFSGIVVFALQTASGWSNPSSNPPTVPGALSYINGNVGINTNNPTSTLSVNGVISAMGNKVVDVADPANGKDAVNLDYLQTQISAAGAGSGGSVVLFYKTVNGVSTSTVNCPTNWTEEYRGYGPHFMGILNYDWQYTSNGATYEGGFGGTGMAGNPPPITGSSYILNSVALASDSICSVDQKSVIPVSQYYGNKVTAGFTTLFADACSVYSGATHCNRCVVCKQ
jgi:hypothetical protein